MTKRSLLTAALLLSALAVQADDFGLWGGVTVQKDITKKWSVDAGADLRLENKLKNVTRYDFALGIDYKPIKPLSLSAGYTFIRDYNLCETEDKLNDEGKWKGYNVDNAYWRSKHRATFDVTGKLPVGRFTLSLRERYQYTHYVGTSTMRTRYRGALTTGTGGFTGNLYYWQGSAFTSAKEVAKNKDAKDKHYLRSRLGIAYNIKHCAFTPYATYEFSNNLSEQMHLDKMRLTVGTEWKIAKRHRLDIAYVYNNGADDDNNEDMHAISIGYKLKF